LDAAIIPKEYPYLQGLMGLNHSKHKRLTPEQKRYYSSTISKLISLMDQRWSELTQEVIFKQTRKCVLAEYPGCTTTISNLIWILDLVLKPLVSIPMRGLFLRKLKKCRNELVLRDIFKVIEQDMQTIVDKRCPLLVGMKSALGFMSGPSWTDELEKGALDWITRAKSVPIEDFDFAKIKQYMIPYMTSTPLHWKEFLEPSNFFADGSGSSNHIAKECKFRFNKTQIMSLISKEELEECLYGPVDKDHPIYEKIETKHETAKDRHFSIASFRAHVLIKPIVTWMERRFKGCPFIYPLCRDQPARLVEVCARLREYEEAGIEVTAFPVDQTTFDVQIRNKLRKRWYEFLRDEIVPLESDPETIAWLQSQISRIAASVDHTITEIRGKKYPREKGLPSGVADTNVDGSWMNLMYTLMALEGLEILDVCCMGDDTLLIIKGKQDIDDLINRYTRIGAVVNKSKNSISQSALVFLQQIIDKDGIYGFPLRDVSGMLYFKPYRNSMEDEGLPVVLPVLRSFISRLMVWEDYEFRDLDYFIKYYMDHSTLKDLKRYGSDYLLHPEAYTIRSRPRKSLKQPDMNKVYEYASKSYLYTTINKNNSIRLSDYVDNLITSYNLYSRLLPKRNIDKSKLYKISHVPYCTKDFTSNYSLLLRPSSIMLMESMKTPNHSSHFTCGYYNIDTIIISSKAQMKTKKRRLVQVLKNRIREWAPANAYGNLEILSSIWSNDMMRLAMGRYKYERPFINTNPAICKRAVVDIERTLSAAKQSSVRHAFNITDTDMGLMSKCLIPLVFAYTVAWFRRLGMAELIFSS